MSHRVCGGFGEQFPPEMTSKMVENLEFLEMWRITGSTLDPGARLSNGAVDLQVTRHTDVPDKPHFVGDSFQEHVLRLVTESEVPHSSTSPFPACSCSWLCSPVQLPALSAAFILSAASLLRQSPFFLGIWPTTSAGARIDPRGRDNFGVVQSIVSVLLQHASSPSFQL